MPAFNRGCIVGEVSKLYRSALAVTEICWCLDLDGVLWLADQPIAGSTEAVEMLRAAGFGVRFVTNNSVPTLEQYRSKLGSFGIEVAEGEVISSSMAAASLIAPGERVYVVGGAGLREAVASAGAEVVDSSDADVVAVGWARDFNFEIMSKALSAILAGARFVATNDDPTYPTPNGLVPGAGSMVRSISYSTGVEPEVSGKPNRAISELLKQSVGSGSVMVGDRFSTDGLFAKRAGMPFYLVLSGVTKDVDPSWEPPPSKVASDLLTLVKGVLN